MKWSSQVTLRLDLIRDTQGFFVSDHLKLGLYRSRLINASSRRIYPASGYATERVLYPWESRNSFSQEITRLQAKNSLERTFKEGGWGRLALFVEEWMDCTELALRK